MTAIIAEVFGLFGERRKHYLHECFTCFVFRFDPEVVVHLKFHYKSPFVIDKTVNYLLIYLIICKMVWSILIGADSFHPS